MVEGIIECLFLFVLMTACSILLIHSINSIKKDFKRYFGKDKGEIILGLTIGWFAVSALTGYFLVALAKPEPKPHVVIPPIVGQLKPGLGVSELPDGCAAVPCD